jgi:hypothetical protein
VQKRSALVALWNRQRSSLPDIRTHVCSTLLDSQDNNAADHGDFDSTENAQGHGADERIAVGQILLESVDGQESKVWFMLRVTQQVDVDQFADLEILGCHILDNLREVLGDIASFGDELRKCSVGRRGEVAVSYRDQSLHCIKLLSVARGIELLAYVLSLVIWFKVQGGRRLGEGELPGVF